MERASSPSGSAIANEIGGTFKISGNRALMAKRNGGRSASGQPLPTVIAAWGDNIHTYDIAPILGRPRFKKTRARFYDQKAAKWKEVIAEVQDEGIEAQITRRHTSADQAEADHHTKNDKASTERNKGEGDRRHRRQRRAKPEGTCIVSGCRPGIDGTYRIETVEHSLSRSGGWTTSLSLKQPAGDAGSDDRQATAPFDADYFHEAAIVEVDVRSFSTMSGTLTIKPTLVACAVN